MKVTINVECTPEEARVLLGLPNWKPMQDRMMKGAEDRVQAYFKKLDPKELVKTWLPAAPGTEQWQSLFSKWRGEEK